MSADVCVMHIDHRTSLTVRQWKHFKPPLRAGWYVVTMRDEFIEGEPVGPYDTKPAAIAAMLEGVWI